MNADHTRVNGVCIRLVITTFTMKVVFQRVKGAILQLLLK